MPHSTGELSKRGEPTAAAHVRGLLELAQLVRSGSGLSELLAAVARVVSETLGFATVVINLYRPETDEYEVKSVHGNERARAILLGNVTHADTWRPQLDPRFLRRGAFFIPEASIEWGDEVAVYTPRIEPTGIDDGSAWLADDALFVTLDGTDGRRLGVIAVDEPESGRRPDDQLLDFLTAVAAHAAQAIESSYQLAQLEGALARHRAIIETSLDAVLGLDSHGRILEFNAAAERTFGYISGEVIGREFAELLIPAEDRAARRLALQQAFDQPEENPFELRVEAIAQRADGSRLPVELSVTLVHGSDEDESVMYCFARDISERRRGEEQLAYLAYHDPLTGLPNRVLVEEQLDLALARARRGDAAVALLFIDLDDFKTVNDRLGHAAGDQLLTAVATRLRGVLRDTDVLARQGGDEFLVVIADLEDEPAHAAEAVGAKLHEALSEPFAVAGAELRITASIGVSVYPDHAADTEALLRHADAAMYRAKGAGGGQMAFHRTGDTILARRASISQQIRRAIMRSEFELHYQPIWSLRGARGIAGIEALLRWRDPDRGLLKPDAFMTLAEHSAAGDQLVEWIVQTACREASGWREAGLSPQISLNVSSHQLLTSSFATRLMASLAAEELEPSSFMVEMTESAWNVDATAVRAELAKLQVAGVTLAIDDFGAGFSSLSRLHELELDAVKLDRRLLAGIPGDGTAVAVTRAIVELARACDAAIIAEGVESEDQITFLIAAGIDLAQGYLFGQPLRADEITPLLTRRLLSGSVAG
ncbi:MAG: putative bifunctional diguanylate cyclase/phosphodiesterase [Solirubrobacteraceae bacterium]